MGDVGEDSWGANSEEPLSPGSFSLGEWLWAASASQYPPSDTAHDFTSSGGPGVPEAEEGSGSREAGAGSQGKAECCPLVCWRMHLRQGAPLMFLSQTPFEHKVNSDPKL